jgi:hypothetical protein
MSGINPYILYLVFAGLISLVVLRILMRGKTGASAIRLEFIYLMVYAFMGGLIVSVFLSQPSPGWLGILVIITFLAGFFLRLYPLLRLISEVEKKTQGKF